MTSMPRIAVVVYEPGESAVADACLAMAAHELRDKRMRLAGSVQLTKQRPNRCRCDILLEDLATGSLIELSEDRGPEARGCHLSPSALEEAVGLAVAAVEGGAELLIINRFGKREAEGHGFRQAIERAVERDIPVLVLVCRSHLDAWVEFGGGLEARLPLATDAVVAWGLDAVEARRRLLRRHPTASTVHS